MLHAKKLVKRFGTFQVIHQLDIDVELGEIRGLLGPNGAGKTTTLQMICGVVAPTSGSIQIGEYDLGTHPIFAKLQVGYVPEGAPLPPELKPIEYFNFVGHMYGIKNREEAVQRWAETCDVLDVLTQTIGTLSRGYKQRVALVAALLHEPKVLVLDEPSSGLDPAQHISFRHVLKEVSKTSAVLYSSHNLHEIEATCDSVTIICEGREIFDGSFEDVSQQPTQFVVELSPHESAKTLNISSTESIDQDWLRVTVQSNDGEHISHEVAKSGGTIRLLQPTASTIESTYLDLIRTAEQVK